MWGPLGGEEFADLLSIRRRLVLCDIFDQLVKAIDCRNLLRTSN